MTQKNEIITLEDKYDASEKTTSMHFIAKTYAQTYLDGSFQRLGGHERGSGWTTNTGKKYLENLFAGATFNCIIVVDIEACLRHAVDIEDVESQDYFNDIKAQYPGVKYISIDGNNTSSFITAFLEDDEKLKISLFGGAPKRFSEFSEEMQHDMTYTEKIKLIKLRKIGVKDMCNLFRALNESTKLNPQEHRQAVWSPFSHFVRAASNSDQEMWTKFVYKNIEHLDKRSHEELIAQLCIKASKKFNSDLHKKSLDDFYTNTKQLDKKTEKDILNIIHEVNKVSKSVGPLSKKLTRGHLHVLYDLMHMVIVEHSCQIKDYKKFFDWFIDFDTKARAVGAQIPEIESEQRSYNYWCKFYAQKACYNKTRDLLETAFMRSNLVADGVISYKRKEGDRFTFPQKIQLWHEQKHLTRDGEVIKAIDLYLGKYEADHVKSVADGGETSISNGELMTVSTNRTKGSNSNKPHFPFQS